MIFTALVEVRNSLWWYWKQFSLGIHRGLVPGAPVCVYSVTKSFHTLSTPWTVACQAPLSMGFPRQESWSGSPFPSPGDLPDPGSEPPTDTKIHGCSSLLFNCPIQWIYSAIHMRDAKSEDTDTEGESIVFRLDLNGWISPSCDTLVIKIEMHFAWKTLRESLTYPPPPHHRPGESDPVYEPSVNANI